MLTTKARCLRIEGNLPADLWPEFYKAAEYLANRTPTRSLKWKTPFESLQKYKPRLSHIKPYGSKAYPLVKKIPRTLKMDERAFIGYLVGWDSTNIYRIWIPSLSRVIRTRDVRFGTEKYRPDDLDLASLLQEDSTAIIEFLSIDNRSEESNTMELLNEDPEPQNPFPELGGTPSHSQSSQPIEQNYPKSNVDNSTDSSLLSTLPSTPLLSDNEQLTTNHSQSDSSETIIEVPNS